MNRPDGMSKALEVRGLSKAFAGTQALASIDLDVNRGEVHALVSMRS
jgi:ABC-type sugar transport system ATPase subunit